MKVIKVNLNKYTSMAFLLVLSQILHMFINGFLMDYVKRNSGAILTQEGFPIWLIMGAIGVLLLSPYAPLACWVWLDSKDKEGQRWLWALIVFILHVQGLIVYLVVHGLINLKNLKMNQSEDLSICIQ